ncbi:sterol desaturase family protein [Marinobacterium arenosum]|uniref:sterol desaturase family protein n=1 Tax=Marinobacterium arenosum TaxID=2862496 RepID=UPI001C944F28|nr:sterol desaturase family protein [Marinobacterium arenosum]MBY4675621.1 sterol desaturase family protein [Marinobacterium arenosum]
MEQWLLAHEATLRLGMFFGVFMAMAGWEWRTPCRTLRLTRWRRWSNNLALVLLNSLLLRLLFPAAAVGVAAWAQIHGWGLLNHVELPLWLALLLSVTALDLLIYWQHRLFHQLPWLWRLHRVHHADLDYDLTTGLRFHPLEILLSMLIKSAAILLLGPPLLAVLLFELILNGMAMFNHGNVQLPPALDNGLRRLLVTPDMHRVHHSIHLNEMHRNFGFNLSIWDRLFGSYAAQPKDGHRGMQIGLPDEPDPRRVDRLDGMLLLPFHAPTEQSRAGGPGVD